MRTPSITVTSAASTTTVSRRTFLLSVLAGFAGVGMVTGCAPSGDGGAMTEQWSAWLLGDGGNRAAVVRLGGTYLQAYPGDSDVAALLRQIDEAIAAQLGQTSDAQAITPPQAGAALERAVRGEYTAGELVNVDGWMLSRTEARAYAAVASLTAR